jgi:hypothetical protein
MDHRDAAGSAVRADLWWLPVGAGGHFVVHTSHAWERLQALRDRRSAQRLFHAALEVFVGDVRHLVEMTPVTGAPAGPRGVVATGPVASPLLGRSRLFRYEVRCWPGGVLPDRRYAVDSPTTLPLVLPGTRTLPAHVTTVPRLTWGRDRLGAGDMWNSNSLISWLLATCGVDARGISPPAGGRAPGWAAGTVAAAGGGCGGDARSRRRLRTRGQGGPGF